MAMRQTLIDVFAIAELQRAAVARWHQQGLDNPFHDFLYLVCHQCSLNYLLWHEEDAARDPSASDTEIARVKRTIDQLNQQRNDFIEHLDRWLTSLLAARRIYPRDQARVNTETPGSAIDRLAILALRIYHLEEQLTRSEGMIERRKVVTARLAACWQQHADLTRSLDELLGEIESGVKRHRIYQPLKLYNDPDFNPYLYMKTRLAPRHVAATLWHASEEG
jgi:hypothetical protein